MKNQAKNAQPARSRQVAGVLLLVTGTGLVFLNSWVRQDFSLLLGWQADLQAGGGRAVLSGLLLLALSWGLSPVSLLLGGGLFLAGLLRTAHPEGVAVPPLADQPGAGEPDDLSAAKRAIASDVAPLGVGEGPLSLQRLSGWLGVAPRQIAFLGLSLLFAVIAGLAAGGGDHMRLPRVAVLAWILGIALAVLGGWRGDHGSLRIDRRQVLAALALAGLAFLVRVYQVGDIPLVLTADEASMGLTAVRFLEGETDNIFAVGWFSHPALFFYLQSKFIDLFGRTILALRLPAVLAGALTVAAVYWLGRSLFGGRIGLYAALFLATLHYHNHFSRLGLNNVWDGLAYTVTLGALWLGWQRSGRSWYLLAGVSLGLAQYFYVSSRILLALVPLWLLAGGFFDRARLRRQLPDMSLMGFVALVTVLPLAFFYFTHPDDYLWPLRQATVLSAEIWPGLAGAGLPGWLARLGQGFLAFTHAPLRFAWYNPGTPILRALPGALFILGALALAVRPRDTRTWLLGGWLIIFGLAGGLSDYTPAAQRYVAAAPALALVAGFGLEAFLSRLQRLWPHRILLLSLGVLLLFLAVGVDELHFYFITYAPYSALGGRDALVIHRLAEALETEPPGSQVALFGGERVRISTSQVVRYLAPQVRPLDMPAPWGSPVNPQPEGERLLFVFLPETSTNLVPVQASYLGGSLSEARDTDGEVLYRLYAYPGAEP
jgi:hypothetical protein